MTIFRGYRARRAPAGIGVLAVLAAAACATADPGAASTGRDRDDALGAAMSAVVDAGFPGVQVVITDAGGQRVRTAGRADTVTGAEFTADARVRIGSNTKTYVAVVIMQLVAEGRVALDDPVEKYLPGVVRGNGNDGNRITVRQLLQHTTGLPDYLASGDPAVARDPNSPQLQGDAAALRTRHFTPRELVDIAMSLPPQYEPGARAVYTNTNYILLGMLVEQVTGKPVAAEIQTRVLDRLGLRDTYFPADGEQVIRGPHPRGYEESAGQRVDFTDLDPSWGGAAGAMVATGADLNRFFRALLAGELLPAPLLAEMRVTVPFDRMPGAGYGLGLIHQPVSCGAEVWGHGGSIPGFETRNGVTAAGVAVTVIVNQLPVSEAQAATVTAALDTALCS
ncbi:serine hydrolase domain-containing protein [Nocardia sp. NPDC005978]|uniref:serine hydrolase domain-containing protein n=1 Tax=Nocardia sp. NPDC005978 TaxID=3156725 RepID=UPI0033BD0E0F